MPSHLPGCAEQNADSGQNGFGKEADGRWKPAPREIRITVFFQKMYLYKRISTGSRGVINRKKTEGLRGSGAI
jgi:hypothetical protein